jgi:hypothetical protein
MRRTLLLSLLVPAAAACTDSEGVQITQDTPIAVAASADRVVVAATEETETTGFGCGGGGGSYGRSVLFVSADRGGSFERIVPDDIRPLTHIASRDGVFYAIAHSNDGGFGVVTSADGAAWSQVASGSWYAQDLAISADAIVVAHGMGVLVSTDGSTWTAHEPSGSGFYQASVASARGMIALGTAADGILRLSPDATTWRDYVVPGFDSVQQLIAAGDSLLVAGYANNGTATIARIDLANLAATPTIRTGFATDLVVTPAGLLDVGGRLATLDANGVGQPVAHLSPFNAAAVDGQEVVVVRGGTIETSSDGGLTFGGTIALPIVRTETAVSDSF